MPIAWQSANISSSQINISEEEEEKERNTKGESPFTDGKRKRSPIFLGKSPSDINAAR